MRPFFQDPEAGGVALEYIIVSVFGLLLAIASISFVGQAAKQKLAQIEQQLGIELKLEDINPFN